MFGSITVTLESKYTHTVWHTHTHTHTLTETKQQVNETNPFIALFIKTHTEKQNNK